jgi:hypothetical protein
MMMAREHTRAERVFMLSCRQTGNIQFIPLEVTE